MDPHQSVMSNGPAAFSADLSQPGPISAFGKLLPTKHPALMLPMPPMDQWILMATRLSTTASWLRNATLTFLVYTLLREVTLPPLLPLVNTGDKKVLRLPPGIPNAGTGTVVIPPSTHLMLRTCAHSMLEFESIEKAHHFNKLKARTPVMNQVSLSSPSLQSS